MNGSSEQRLSVCRRSVSRLCLVAGALAVCLSLTGCSRKYWREQADDLSYTILEGKQVDPRWEVPRTDVIPDPRSRFYDPYDPDFTPIPPDDPAAHNYMHWVYGMRGYSKWHEFSDLPAVENPDWLNPFGLSPEVVAANYGKPALLPAINQLTLEEAIELSWIHSRDYQTQIENVYLLALVLTFERFRFDVQYIGFTGLPTAEATFEDVPGTSDTVGLASSIGVSKLFPSGAQFVTQLANNTLWLFAGGNVQDSSASTISYSLVQPLLANAGRRFVLAGLTQSERDVLYALRDLARYRMGFFTSTVAGGGTAGLSSGVQGAPQPLGALTTPIVSGAGPNAGGYLLLLQQMQQVSNQRYNIRQLKERLDRLHASANQRPDRIGEDLGALPPDVRIPEEFGTRLEYHPETRRLILRGTLTDAEENLLLSLSDDVDYQRAVSSLADRAIMEIETINQSIAQLETQLAASCNALRSSVVQLLDNIDRYKMQLGLPTDMPITIDDSLLKPFELVDPQLTRLQDRLNTFVPDPPPVSDRHPDSQTIRRVQSIWQRFDERDPDINVLRELAREMELLREDIHREGFEVLESDFRRWEEHRKLAIAKPPADDCVTVYRDPQAEFRLKETVIADFRSVEENLKKLMVTLEDDDLTEEKRLELLGDLSDLREAFLKTTQSLTVIQINLRIDLIELNPFEMTLEDAVGVGLENRMDLMNVRAQVMDARRDVEVAANQLQAVMNVVVEGDIRTQSNVSGNLNPFDFRGSQSSLRAGLQFTAPVQLVQQRNTYRSTLIGYQRARRNYMRVEDEVKFNIRATWRQLNVLKQNFETARENIRAATAQLDIAVEQSSAPVNVPAAGAATQGSVQGLNILQALTSVLNAQNQLIQIWAGYEANRLNIHNFMGIMQVDPDGFWVDDFYQSRAQAARAGRSLVEFPPESLPAETPPRAPQELPDEPADVNPPEELPPPEPNARRRRRPTERLQLVKAEAWPDRTQKGDAEQGATDASPQPSAPRRDRASSAAVVDPGRSRRGGRVRVEGQPLQEEH